jgi:hypothetical protein
VKPAQHQGTLYQGKGTRSMGITIVLQLWIRTQQQQEFASKLLQNKENYGEIAMRLHFPKQPAAEDGSTICHTNGCGDY